MAFNKFMHPRNRYRKEKPCFLKLALKYSDFRAHVTQDETGKAVLDFKNADALRALTTCLLKEDFGLTVQLPSNRLVPTLPLRLNYIHWIEDIIGMDKEIWGVDIGLFCFLGRVILTFLKFLIYVKLILFIDL